MPYDALPSNPPCILTTPGSTDLAAVPSQVCGTGTETSRVSITLACPIGSVCSSSSGIQFGQGGTVYAMPTSTDTGYTFTPGTDAASATLTPPHALNSCVDVCPALVAHVSSFWKASWVSVL
jgi:hypothetical protein